MKALLLRLARGPAGRWLVRSALGPLEPLLPLRMIYKSAGLIALPHPSPSHPVHIMLVPRQPIATSANLDTEHGALLVEVHRAAAQIALQLGLEGYRLIINNGSYQDVDQLHFHLISGPPA